MLIPALLSLYGFNHFKLLGVRESAKLEVAPDDKYRVLDYEKPLLAIVSLFPFLHVKLHQLVFCDKSIGI